MRCEVLAVGTELLLGQIVDTNSSWLGAQLAASGIDSLHQTKVGDNLGRIVDALRLALSRSDAVIVCGGLGPTQDDITREAIAAVMGVELALDEEAAARIEAMFTSRGRRMTMNNLRQAEVPVGATAIADPQPGTAPGLICPLRFDGQDKVIYAVPGVPHEMMTICETVVLPDLRQRAGVRSVIVSRVLRTWGESESGLAERLAARIRDLDHWGNPTLAFLASGMEGIKVRITAKAETEADAAAMVEAEQERLLTLIGDVVFGFDDDNMEVVVARALRDQGLSLGLAESLTGGLIAARLTSVPGVSACFKGAVVAYDANVKFDLLEVPRGPVVSAGAVQAMAEGAARVLDADVGLAVTGVAGPDTQDGQPVGTVFIGLHLDGHTESTEVRLPGDRERIREYTVISALDLLRRRLAARTGAQGSSGSGAPPA